MLEMRASSRLRANRNYNTAGSVKRMGRVGGMMQLIQSFATYTSPMMHLICPAGGGGQIRCIMGDVQVVDTAVWE